MSGTENTFLTSQTKHKSNFEQKYLERFGGTNECPECLPQLSPQLVQKKQEMEKTNAELDDARIKFEAWKTNFQRKKKELDEKQKILDIQKENLRSFTEHHNHEIEKAHKKEEVEKNKIVELKAELQRLNDQENDLEKENESLKERLGKLQPCADYLQAVVEKSSFYETVESLLNRYETLSTTRSEYVEKLLGIMQNFGSDEDKLNAELMNRRDKLLERTMQLNRSKQHTEMIKKDNQNKMTQMYKKISRSELKSVEIAEIKSAIKTIFSRAYDKSITNAQKASVGPNPTLQEMILFIRNRFKDLQGILNDPQIEYSDPSQAPPHMT